MDLGPEVRLLGSEEEKVENFKRRVWEESKRVWAIAFPSMLCRVTTYGAYVVSQASFGYLSEVDLAAYALVQTILVRFSNGILLGMASVTESLCGEAFGAKQYEIMGVHLQRSWIVNTAVATAMVPFYVFATPLLRLLGQEEEIAVAAGNISLCFIPILYLNVYGMTMQMFLQAQHKNMVVGWLFAILFFAHAFLSWIFVYKLKWGLPGVMAALIIAFGVKVLGEAVYIFGGWCQDSWKGFSRSALTNLMPVLKSSISSGVMLTIQVWYNAILVLLAGYMKYATVAISAFSICLNITTWELMICLGFLGAVWQKDEAAGEVPVAFVVRSNGSEEEISEDEVKAYVAKQVVFYKKLHKVYFVNVIPKSASGKILRKELRTRLDSAANHSH